MFCLVTETPTDTDAKPFGSRVRERFESVSPFSLAMLGFVGFLGDVFPQLELLTLFHLFWLFALWPFVSMLLGGVKQSLGHEEDEADPRAWLDMDMGWRGHFAFLLGVPLSVLNPLLFRQDAMQLLGSLVAILRHRGSLPCTESHTQSTTYRLPVEGEWTVVNGSPIKEYSHSWFPATQRYAYDFVITDDDGRTRPTGTDTSIENYYCYDQPVLAPADGTVVSIHDHDPELDRAGGFSHPLKRSVTGNRVTIYHGNGEYSSLVHLVPGSIEVEPGERIERGEQIGRCGHSGNSSEPHLHFQLQEHPTFEVAAGLPVRFDEVAIDTPGADVVELTNWEEPDGTGQYVHVGQRVTHTPEKERRRDDTAKSPETTATARLDSINTSGQLANGLAIGGLLTVLVGFVVSSLPTIAFGLAGLTGLVFAYHALKVLSGDNSVRLGSFATAVGLGVAAAMVGAFGSLALLPEVDASTVGVGVFMAGFALYIAVWEYVRRGVFRDGVTVTSTVD